MPEQLIFTTAELIALNGVNNSSIGVCMNTLIELTASHNGLPVAFVIRGLLAKKSDQSALDFIKGVCHTSGQNYIVGIGDKVYDFEVSASNVMQYTPVAGCSFVYHTNHPLVNNDLKPWWAKRLQQRTLEEQMNDNSIARFTSLESRFGKNVVDIDEHIIKEAPRSKDSKLYPVCRPLKSGDFTYTFGSTIMTLSNHPSIQITFGPSDLSEYILYSFNVISTPADKL